MSDHEKVELSEQTPLKSDVDPPAVGETTATETAEGAQPIEAGPITTTEKKKFTWFRKEKKKPEETAAITPVKEVETGEPEKVKKCKWWTRKPCGTEEQQMTVGVNLVQRDDRQLHSAIDLGFEDIFGEPDAVHSINGIWRATFSIFTAVRCFFYKLFALILAIPSAIVFGILYALASALQVFCCVPIGRLLSIPARWLFKAWSFIFTNVFDPVFNSIGRCFSGISIRRYGIPSDVTATIA
ncbi:Protein CAV-1 a [Aphelenchoides avenae]|nr:Protein CAV-1 a [Aphelenchus avenae]